MAQDNKTQFIVEVVKQGEGAAQASAALNQVAATEKQVLASTQQMNAALVQANSTLGSQTPQAARNAETALNRAAAAQRSMVLGAKDATAAMRTASLLIGGQFFPQITQAAFSAGIAIDAVRKSGEALAIGTGRMTLVLVGITSALWTGVEAWRAYKAQQQEALSFKALETGNTSFRKVIEEQIALLEKAGRISGDLASAFRGRISDEFYNTVSPDPARQHDLLKYLAGEIRRLSGAQSSESMQMRAFTHQLLGESLTGDTAERFALQEAFAARNRKIEAMEASGARPNPMLGDPRKYNEQILENGIRAIEERAAALTGKLQDELAQFETGLQGAARTGFDKQLFELDTIFDRNRESIEGFRNALNLTAEETRKLHDLNTAGYDAQKAKIQELINLEAERTNRTVEAAERTSEGMKMLEIGAREFSSGMSGAIIDFASGVKEADEAFREFGANFLRTIADMILQAVIFSAVKAGLDAFGFKLADGGMVRAMASGGLQPSGVPGAFMTSGPMHFPKFNALAGEAGPEVLTVLRAPKMLSVGGMIAASGYAGNTPLSLVNTQHLKKFASGGMAGGLPGEFSGLANGGGGGGGGVLRVFIEHSEAATVRIIEQSSNVAVQTVARQMGEDSDVSRATKRLVA